MSNLRWLDCHTRREAFSRNAHWTSNATYLTNVAPFSSQSYSSGGIALAKTSRTSSSSSPSAPSSLAPVYTSYVSESSSRTTGALDLSIMAGSSVTFRDWGSSPTTSPFASSISTKRPRSEGSCTGLASCIFVIIFAWLCGGEPCRERGGRGGGFWSGGTSVGSPYDQDSLAYWASRESNVSTSRAMRPPEDFGGGITILAGEVLLPYPSASLDA